MDLTIYNKIIDASNNLESLKQLTWQISQVNCWIRDIPCLVANSKLRSTWLEGMIVGYANDLKTAEYVIMVHNKQINEIKLLSLIGD